MRIEDRDQHYLLWERRFRPSEEPVRRIERQAPANVRLDHGHGSLPKNWLKSLRSPTPGISHRTRSPYGAGTDKPR